MFSVVMWTISFMFCALLHCTTYLYSSKAELKWDFNENNEQIHQIEVIFRVITSPFTVIVGLNILLPGRFQHIFLDANFSFSFLNAVSYFFNITISLCDHLPHSS